MKKEELIALGLDEATAIKVEKASTEELKVYIPKVRFDEVNNDKKALELTVKERDTQLETLKTSTGDVETLKKTITTLQTENTTKAAAYEAQLKQLQIDNAVEKALTNAKAKNIKAVKALLDLDKAELDGETVKGLEDQLKKLNSAEDTKFLFDTETKPDKPTFKGFVPGEKKDGVTTEAPTSLADAVKMHLAGNEQQK